MRTQKVMCMKGLLLLAIMAIATAMISTLSAGFAYAASASEIDRNATQALSTLYATPPGARALADKSKAILIFPRIIKGGLIVGGQFGDGALRKRGRTVGYYRSLSASYGFQAGASRLATCCSLWTRHRLHIWTKVVAGNSELGRVS